MLGTASVSVLDTVVAAINNDPLGWTESYSSWPGSISSSSLVPLFAPVLVSTFFPAAVLVDIVQGI